MYNYLDKLKNFENNEENVLFSETKCINWKTYIRKY